MKDNRKNEYEHRNSIFFFFEILFFLVYCILSVLSKLGILGHFIPFWNEWGQLYKALLADGIFTLIGFLLFKEEILKGIQHIKSDFENHHKQIIYAAFFDELATILITLFLNFIVIKNNEHQGNIDSAFKNQSPILIIVCVVILGPVIEELLYRGIIFSRIIKKNRIVAYAASSVLFGLAHVWYEALAEGNPAQLVFIFVYMVSGICYDYIYEKTENIVWPIIVHAVINMLALI